MRLRISLPSVTSPGSAVPELDKNGICTGAKLAWGDGVTAGILPAAAEYVARIWNQGP